MKHYVCPSCNGKRTSGAVACGPNGCQWIETPCEVCRESGIVTERQQQHWHDARKLKDLRVKHGWTTKRLAELLSISREELVKAETVGNDLSWHYHVRFATHLGVQL